MGETVGDLEGDVDLEDVVVFDGLGGVEQLFIPARKNSKINTFPSLTP